MHGLLEVTEETGEETCPLRHLADEGCYQDLDGYHHMFRGDAPPGPQNDLGSLDYTDPDSTPHVLFRLAKVIGQNFVDINATDAIDNRKTDDSQGIPAGYSYLLQLACHDLVHTNVAIPTVKSGGPSVRNLRSTALNLETLYGGGPGACPFAFERSRSPNQLRRKLKLRRPSDDPQYGPKRCLEIVSSGGTEPGGPGETSDVMIADPRNDVIPMLSQMTALFHGFHNVMVCRLKTIYPSGSVGALQGDHVGDIGICARAVTAYIYRRIVRQDLLKRLLDPEVYEAYASGAEFIDTIGQSGSVPVEFALATSRIGHAMVRPKYTLNQTEEGRGRRSYDLARLQNHSLGFSPKGLEPIQSRHLIDWHLFFGRAREADPDYNWSIRIGPHTITFFRKGKHFKSPYAKPPFNDDGGLPFRDLLRGPGSKMRSATDLIRDMKQQPNIDPRLLRVLSGITLGWAEDVMRTTLTRMLDRLPQSERPGLSDADIRKLVAHPPLFLFALAEAWIEGKQGAHLGPLTSIIFAEVFFRALDRSSPDLDADMREWEEKSKTWTEQIFGSLSAAPNTMQELLDVMETFCPNALRSPSSY